MNKPCHSGHHHLPAFMEKMKNEGLPGLIIDTFAGYYNNVLSGETGLISDKDILPVKSSEVQNSNTLSSYEKTGTRALTKAVMLVLNGGLGTSMGLKGPKSLIEVKKEKTFLDIIMERTGAKNIQLVLMNSFNTHHDTQLFLSKSGCTNLPMMFLQHKFPKIFKTGLSPALWQKNPDLEWNPPGHGDIYAALYTSGMIEALLDKGIEFAFIRNSDNLGATMDTSLLGYFVKHEIPFMMEVAARTPADSKGGHLCRHNQGHLMLREIAQCPEQERDAFVDIGRYGFFNTNNLWINLKRLKEIIENKKMLLLPMILNPKHIDSRDDTSPMVYQVESAMGAAISFFKDAVAVQVPRSRFFPVKKCADLMAVRSNCFIVSNGQVGIHEGKNTELPRIDLDMKYYGKIDSFDKRFPNGIPDLIHCETLKIEGDVRFGKNVTIRGKAVIKNTQQYQAFIEDGKCIEGNILL
ncbi:UTP--glucose-1-phosphate uridylyltransferase [Desulfobacterales bacterium HSG16]|nr:UTP--glucose-1-phosphate uridylyltransferase [Desulfobacterales bacterium HSG16]